MEAAEVGRGKSIKVSQKIRDRRSGSQREIQTDGAGSNPPLGSLVDKLAIAHVKIFRRIRITPTMTFYLA